MTEVSIAWIDGDWVAASDRALEKWNRWQGRRWWIEPWTRPWLKTSVHMQTWANEPYRATREPLTWFYKVDGSIPKVWWLRQIPRAKELSFIEDLSIELPFLTRYYFQTHLFLTVEASLFEFVRDYHDENMDVGDKNYLSELQRRKPGSTEIERWTGFLTYLKPPLNEYSSTVRKTIFDAIQLLRHKTIHREKVEDDDLWYSMQLPELLGDWRRTFEIQQVFMFVRDASAMEKQARQEIDQLLYGPEMPPQTLLQAHTWLQHSLERLCFRFTQRNYPSMLKDRKWEWPEQSELQRSWQYALTEIRSYDNFLDPAVLPDDENQLFSHYRLRSDAIEQGRYLRDAASHRDVGDAKYLQKHALNGILLAIMLGDREQAIEIEATIEAFLTGKTKYQVLTRLRAACAYDRPIPTDQLGERKKREALATYLGDKEVYTSEATNELPLISAVGGSVNTSLKIPSTSANSEYCTSERQGFDPIKDDNDGRTFSGSAEWGSAIKKFVMGDSMHDFFGSKEELFILPVDRENFGWLS